MRASTSIRSTENDGSVESPLKGTPVRSARLPRRSFDVAPGAGRPDHVNGIDEALVLNLEDLFPWSVWGRLMTMREDKRVLRFVDPLSLMCWRTTHDRPRDIPQMFLPVVPYEKDHHVPQFCRRFACIICLEKAAKFSSTPRYPLARSRGPSHLICFVILVVSCVVFVRDRHFGDRIGRCPRFTQIVNLDYCPVFHGHSVSLESTARMRPRCDLRTRTPTSYRPLGTRSI
jgi:hypothetical protein